MTLAPEHVKSCCVSAYSVAAARWLLGDSFHPGGAELTERLARALRVGPGKLVVDVASGPGTSALQVARGTGCDVIGIDLSAQSVAAATRAAAAADLAGHVRFVQGDAELLPLADATVDGALCECALCTFPGKATAVRQLARVLKPGARVAISDVTAIPDRLSPQLTSLQAWVTCVADARPLDEIAALLEDADLVIETMERHDGALEAMLDQVDARLGVARMLGVLGYAAVVARRP